MSPGKTFTTHAHRYDWKKGADFKNLKRVWTEITSVYPCVFEKIKYFNAGMAMNVVASMLRPFLPENLRSKLEFGCQFDKRLDELYLTPTIEAANERFLSRIKYNLQRRYDNEKNFKLS